MNVNRILDFLKDVAVNNNRPWFQTHKDEYLTCKGVTLRKPLFVWLSLTRKWRIFK